MKLEQIEVTIGKDGKVRLRTSGFSGDLCLEATEDLERLLGGNVLEREPTAEAYDAVRVKASVRVRTRH